MPSPAQVVKSVLLRTGFYSAFRRVVPSRSLAILRYHAVCDSSAGYADPGICVSPAAFNTHVDYLADNYNVVSLPEAVDALRRGLSLPTNAVAITFDDGYADNLPAAHVLARRGLSATFYITAGCLADGAPFWPSELRALVAALSKERIDLDVAGTKVVLPTSTPGERRAAVSKLNKIFKGHTIPVREAVRDQLRKHAGGVATPSPMLTRADLVAMHRMGMVIGSHTQTHPNLPNAGIEDAQKELQSSKANLEREIDTPVTMFSYPNGGAERYMTPAIAQLVREAGYDAATTSRNAFAGSSSDLFALERVQVSEDLDDLVFSLEIERFAFKPKARPGELS